jgi:four helix bundle protein
MKYVESYKELEVYKVARELSKSIFEITKGFPKEEMYSLTDQVTRSSRSIGAQIAEAWGKRKYEKYFVSKLTDADSEQQETQHWIETATDCSSVTREEAHELLTRCSSIGKMLNSMMKKSDMFCAHEAEPLYGSTENKIPITEN